MRLRDNPRAFSISRAPHGKYRGDTDETALAFSSLVGSVVP
jgi:hypothetical protein